MTLNQALASWIIERQLERSKAATSPFAPNTVIGFCTVMEHSFSLPHPAIKKITLPANVKSTDMSKLVFNLLDRLFNAIFDGKKHQIADIYGLQTLRFCANNPPRSMKLLPLPGLQTVHAIDSNTNALVSDNAAIDLFYISSFGLSFGDDNYSMENNEKRKRSPPTIPVTSLHFQKVHVFDDATPSGTLSNALIKVLRRYVSCLHL